MKGMTLKQAARAQYLDACEDLNKRVSSGSVGFGLVLASIRVHSLKGNVPKRMWSMATRASKGQLHPEVAR